MGLLGNIGGVESRQTPGLSTDAAHVDRKLERHSIETRLALEKLRNEIIRLQGTLLAVTGVNGAPGPPGPPGSPGASGVLPAFRSLPYPFVVDASSVFPPDGVTLLGSSPYRVTFAEIHMDPAAAPASANTTFTIQNASSSPTQSGGVTIASGARRGSSAINVLIGSGQRLFIKAPAALNGVQNLWIINLGLEQP